MLGHQVAEARLVPVHRDNARRLSRGGTAQYQGQDKGHWGQHRSDGSPHYRFGAEFAKDIGLGSGAGYIGLYRVTQKQLTSPLHALHG